VHRFNQTPEKEVQQILEIFGPAWPSSREVLGQRRKTGEIGEEDRALEALHDRPARRHVSSDPAAEEGRHEGVEG
jgi:hypothetical protein